MKSSSNSQAVQSTSPVAPTGAGTAPALGLFRPVVWLPPPRAKQAIATQGKHARTYPPTRDVNIPQGASQPPAAAPAAAARRCVAGSRGQQQRRKEPAKPTQASQRCRGSGHATHKPRAALQLGKVLRRCRNRPTQATPASPAGQRPHAHHQMSECRPAQATRKSTTRPAREKRPSSPLCAKCVIGAGGWAPGSQLAQEPRNAPANHTYGWLEVSRVPMQPNNSPRSKISRASTIRLSAAEPMWGGNTPGKPCGQLRRHEARAPANGDALGEQSPRQSPVISRCRSCHTTRVNWCQGVVNAEQQRRPPHAASKDNASPCPQAFCAPPEYIHWQQPYIHRHGVRRQLGKARQAGAWQRGAEARSHTRTHTTGAGQVQAGLERTKTQQQPASRLIHTQDGQTSRHPRHTSMQARKMVRRLPWTVCTRGRRPPARRRHRAGPAFLPLAGGSARSAQQSRHVSHESCCSVGWATQAAQDRPTRAYGRKGSAVYACIRTRTRFTLHLHPRKKVWVYIY